MSRNTLLRLALRSPVFVAVATSALAFLFLVGGLAPTENAVANGDTRTIHLYHTHTHESIAATYLVDGRYDPAVLRQLNHFLRDWRNNDEINMDPRLFDVIWETYRESGSTQPIQVVSAYRSPTTNAMLRRRSKAVAEHSQHMLGKAMDMHYTDVPMSKIREIALRLQRGGVGYYPTSGIPFVHLDVGSVRYWPRMSYDALARLFPDGKAVFLASDGRMLPHYQEAREEIAARGSAPEQVAAAAHPRSFFAMLFGGGDDQSTPAAPPAPRVEAVPPARAALDTRPTASLQPAVAVVTTDKQRAANGRLAWQAGPSGVATADTAADLPAVPLPPRRPLEVAALTADTSSIPLPPARPALETGAVAPLLRAANVPAVITQGSSAAAASAGPGAALAYAAPISDAVPSPRSSPMVRALRPPAPPRPAALAPVIGLRAAMAQKPPDFVAARLDPSNFRVLSAPVPIARTTSESQLGAMIGGLRSSVRFGIVQLAFGPPSAVAAHFGSVTSDLRTSRFTGPAVRPLSLLFSETSPASQDTAQSRQFD